MKFLTKKDAVKWCRENQIHLDERELPFLTKSSKDFNIPSDAGQRVALVTSQFEHFRDEDEILIWITAWGVWPSSERLHIFDRLRLSYGEKRLLNEISAHVVSKNEYEDGLSILILAVLFLWDCYVLSKSGKFIFYSHDECGWNTNKV